MRTVEINGINLFDEYGIIMKHYEISPLSPNLFSTEVTGMDGELDYTDFYGDLTYKNRTITIELLAFYDKDTPRLMYFLENELSGKMVKVSFSDDEDYYWQGRLSFSKNDNDTKKVDIDLSVNAHPFKYLKNYETEQRNVSNSY